MKTIGRDSTSSITDRSILTRRNVFNNDGVVPALMQGHVKAHLLVRLLSRPATYYSIAVFGLFIHLVFGLPLYQWYDRALGWLTLVIFLIVLRVTFWQARRGVPVALLVAGQIYLFYGMAQFSQSEMSLIYGETFVPPSETLTWALSLTVAGELLFLFGYYVASPLSEKVAQIVYKSLPIPTEKWVGGIAVYGVVGFLISAIIALHPNYLPLTLRFILSQIFNIYLGLALLLYVGLNHGSKRALRLANAIVVGMLLIGLTEGMLGTMMGSLVESFVARWVWQREIRLKWIVIVILLFILLNPVKYEFRNEAWVKQEKEVTSLKQIEYRLETWLESFQRVWINGETQKNIVEANTSRTSELLPFAQVIDEVPSKVPYDWGRSLRDGLFFIVPRFIAPNKGSSSDLLYNRYAVTFRFTTPEGTEKTTVGISIFAEGYWNFGALGVLFYLLSAGLILGNLFAANGKYEVISVIVCLTYLGPVIFPLQPLAVTIPAIIVFIIGIFISMSLLRFFSQVSFSMR
jgi:hypothetical protein